ncbi:MAG: Rieske 2Fe-2S domain-containing protein [Hyphomicrobiales bacterium]|nr:Rieske 2Fe-2S domain-containing protein [Hyphomicrobiales bacterium]
MLDKPSDLPKLHLPLNEDPQQSYTLPSGYYTDPAIYELEKEMIFYRTWQYICHVSEVAKSGDYVTMRICDQNVFVMRGEDGGLRAFYNVCRHRAHELLKDGSGSVKNVITCPYHAWTYEKTGALRGAPNSDKRPEFCKENFGLRQIRLEEFLGCVFVNLDDNAVGLNVQAGDLADDIRKHVPYLNDLQPTGSRFIDPHINAGWKVVVDNYVECYHCSHAHPAFSSMICMDTYELDTFGLWSRQYGKDINAKNDAYPVDPNGNMFSAFWFLWPNMTFNILPGGKGMTVLAIRPVKHDESLFEGTTLSADGKVSKEQQAYGTNVLGPEDTALCESVQRGLMSKGYDQGPIIVDPDRDGVGEKAIHHFHRLVQGALATL